MWYGLNNTAHFLRCRQASLFSGVAPRRTLRHDITQTLLFFCFPHSEKAFVHRKERIADPVFLKALYSLPPFTEKRVDAYMHQFSGTASACSHPFGKWFLHSSGANCAVGLNLNTTRSRHTDGQHHENLHFLSLSFSSSWEISTW